MHYKNSIINHIILNETTITLEGINPIEFWGIDDVNLNLLKKSFPKLRIVVRGEALKAIGDEEMLQNFQKKIQILIAHFEKFNQLTEGDIRLVVQEQSENNDKEKAPATPANFEAEPLVFGPNGIVVRARTKNQKVMVESALHNDILFAIGPAGTGKTYTAVALAVKALKNKEVKRIILTRPAVEAGENLGFLPGDLKEKIDPYLRPLYDALDDMIPADKLKLYLENRTIEIAPLAFMRGRTLDNAFVILDEGQNATDMQLKMFLTRMGPTAKFIVTGDVTQIDLPKKSMSGLFNAITILKNISGIDIIYLTGEDVVRHKLVKKILEAYGDIQ
jgi:phosphate starvation-inducible PhoH-like protein